MYLRYLAEGGAKGHEAKRSLARRDRTKRLVQNIEHSIEVIRERLAEMETGAGHSHREEQGAFRQQLDKLVHILGRKKQHLSESWVTRS